MFSFFKRKPAKQPVPAWAAFFNAEEYQQFTVYVEDYFRAKKIDIDLDHADGTIRLGDNSFGFSTMGLVNVAQMCKQLEPAHRKALVTEHFDNMRRTHDFQQDFDESINDFEYARQFIGVRLYHIDYIREIGPENVVYRNITEEIIAMLVFDLPTHVSNIKPAQIDTWSRSMDELFELGIANIKANYELDISKQDIGECSLWFVQGDHFFTGNIVFDLAEQQRSLIGSKGALIGIPHRHAVLIYPIENLGVVKAVNTLIPIISGMNEEGPGSISHQLYWYHNGQFTNLPYELTDTQLKFIPPESFIGLLNTLQSDN